MVLTNDSPQLDFHWGLPLNVSPVLPNSCSGSVSGTTNPDGQCVLGGTMLGGVCTADPTIWYQEMVPYTTGRVSSTNYRLLDNIWTRGNNTRLNNVNITRRS